MKIMITYSFISEWLLKRDIWRGDEEGLNLLMMGLSSLSYEEKKKMLGNVLKNPLRKITACSVVRLSGTLFVVFSTEYSY